MQKTEFILATTQDVEVAEKIINVGLNINFDQGVVNIMGQRAVKTVLGKDELTSLPMYYNIRLAEHENIPIMANETPEQKNKREANKLIFESLINTVKTATETAINSLNQLHNAE